MKRRQFFLRRCALAVVLVLGSTATAAQVGLVGHWTFDEGQGTMAFDSSGNGLDGMLRGNPAWVPGQLGGSLSFNGSSDYVEVPDHPLLALTEQITIAAWTNMKTNSSGEMAILSKGGWAANDLPYELTEERGAVIFWHRIQIATPKAAVTAQVTPARMPHATQLLFSKRRMRSTRCAAS